MELAEYFTNKKSFATTLLTILVNEYGSEFMEWDPVATALQIKDDFGVDLAGSISDRIQAGTAVFVSNGFHTSFETYVTMCNAFSFELNFADNLVPADLDSCAWGCTEAKLLEGVEYDTEGFSQDIKKYVGYLLDAEGILKPPSVLNFASYPPQTLENTQNSMLNDEIMYKVFWEKQQEKKLELETGTQQRLADLFVQLQNLPIKNVNSDYISNAVMKLHKALNNT